MAAPAARCSVARCSPVLPSPLQMLLSVPVVASLVLAGEAHAADPLAVAVTSRDGCPDEGWFRAELERRGVRGQVRASLGALAGVAALAFGVCLGFAGDATTLRFACKTCTVGVVRERLEKEERARLSAARRRSAAVAIGCGAAAVAFLALPGGTDRTLADSSFGMAWSVRVPGSHSRTGSDVATLQVPAGAKRARVQWAERSFFAGKTYFLATMQYTFPGGSADPDKPGLQASVKQLVEVYFNGAVTGALKAVGDSFEAELTGTFHGKPVAGRIRGTQFEHDMVMVVVTAADAAELRDADIDAFLASVVVERGVK